MAPISEKRATSQQQEVVIQASTPTTTMLKENGLGVGPHAFAQNALSHGHHNNNHGHGHQHHQQPHLHHSHHHHNHNHNNNNHHAKENATGRSVVVGGGKGLEILDFHESWLEEMEVYKDLMHVKKLGSHNHAHKLPQGGHIEVVNNHNISANKMSHLTSTNATSLDAVRATGGGGGVGAAINNVVTNGNAKRRSHNETKTRVRVATTLAAVEAAAVERTHDGINVGSVNQVRGFD